ncbi:sulfotransferase domain-containing protein [Limnofasciculus baicalensis]|uniref:Sulfotransferase domain-containing protein n=1 Tax=Limnofasciculus baicalensis BBK-W-15 TaxID=2699891 RepID=A0AAE3GN23_9CYAN|nr:sulfotransferase domain-containing protein [Limnofasciculus baicalensis]MCP2727414.1 sulfotransferase domain-containing protein [Limnofasciculus baicalensis BBK-W-15]
MPNLKLNDTSSSKKKPDLVLKDSLPCQYVLIAGPGRSGTTWLGQIMNSYEHCCYKYEPFLPSKSTPYSQWKQDLESRDTEELRHRFQALCSRAYHDVDMPPFPPKSFRKQNPQLLHLLYSLGNRIEGLKFLYEWYGSPKMNGETSVLIKDVNFPNKLLPRLCDLLQPHLLAMIRNPFANIASYLKGVSLDLFQKPDQLAKATRLRESIATSASLHLFQYCDRLDRMSIEQLEAIRWCLQVEPLIQYAQTYEGGLVVVYEDLCADPHGKTTEIFQFVGWEIGESTRDFIKASTSGEKQSSKTSNSYYSVYRDPRESMSKWKQQLTPEQIADIASVVRESPAINLWSDLLI